MSVLVFLLTFLSVMMKVFSIKTCKFIYFLSIKLFSIMHISFISINCLLTVFIAYLAEKHGTDVTHHHHHHGLDVSKIMSCNRANLSIDSSVNSSLNVYIISNECYQVTVILVLDERYRGM